jgi:hypothetical protein
MVLLVPTSKVVVDEMLVLSFESLFENGGSHKQRHDTAKIDGCV